MSTMPLRRPSIHDIDERAARRRERFADLALIAPTPEMIRRVLALEARAEDEPGRTAIIAVEPDAEPATAER